MKLESPAFEDSKSIPTKYTGEGEDISPPLVIKDIPPEAVALAIIMEDPDAPSAVFDHWIAWNIPVEGGVIPEGAHIPKLGQNHFMDLRYRGPMPPRGCQHRYIFKAFALNTMINLPEGISKQELLKGMEGHICAEAILIGTYKRQAAATQTA